MSSTKRGGERHKDDLYETPTNCTEAIFPFLSHEYFTVIEPSAGNGAMLRPLLKRFPVAKHIAMELDRGRAKRLHNNLCKSDYNINVSGRDFLKTSSLTDHCSNGDSPKLFITNPPYKLAIEFVKKCLKYCDFSQGDEVAMLLRYGFIATRKRKEFHDQYPCDMAIFHRRPSFTKGGTDSCEYAWFLWGKGRGGRYWLI